jgi:hypothetical protein
MRSRSATNSVSRGLSVAWNASSALSPQPTRMRSSAICFSTVSVAMGTAYRVMRRRKQAALWQGIKLRRGALGAAGTRTASILHRLPHLRRYDAPGGGHPFVPHERGRGQMKGHTCSPGSGESGSGKQSPQPRKRLSLPPDQPSDDGAEELARRASAVVERGRHRYAAGGAGQARQVSPTPWLLRRWHASARRPEESPRLER